MRPRSKSATASSSSLPRCPRARSAKPSSAERFRRVVAIGAGKGGVGKSTIARPRACPARSRPGRGARPRSLCAGHPGDARDRASATACRSCRPASFSVRTSPWVSKRRRSSFSRDISSSGCAGLRSISSSSICPPEPQPCSTCSRGFSRSMEPCDCPHCGREIALFEPAERSQTIWDRGARWSRG